MDKLAQLSMLIDIYGNLLTPKQLEIIDLYYNNDYSLGEISENLNISRQGVHDSLKRSENLLNEYEEKLQLVKKFNDDKEKIKKVLDRVKPLKDKENISVECKSELSKIETELEKIIFDTEVD